MIVSARVQAAIELLGEIATVPRPADALVSAYFRARRYIGSKDRAAISSLFYSALRHTGRVEWWLGKLGADVSPRGAMLVYLALYERTILDVAPQKSVTKEIVKSLEELFDGKKFAPDRLDADERKLLGKLEGRTPDHPDMPDDVACECPPWAAPALHTKFGSHFKTEMAAMLKPAPLDLRVNSLKMSRDEALKRLKAQGFSAESCRYAPYGLRLRARPSLSDLALLKEGVLEIQDEGSQLVALLLDAKAGERVVDFCAGAGGKTLAIAAQMQNKGRIVACDVLENRLKRSTERFRRAGFHNIEIKPLTSEHDPWVKRHKASFDRVLVDAPCSGTGTWRRNPDQRWRSLGPMLENLLPLQARILESAARLVKEGGRLVYATCSILLEENEAQIENFLKNHADFTRVPLADLGDLTKDLPKTGDDLSLSPAQHDTDGFYAAVLVRQKGEAPQAPQDPETAPPQA